MTKWLELVVTIFDQLNDAEIELTEQESALFVPALVDKLGNNKEHIRVILRDCLERLPSVLPLNRIYPFLADGLKSKNGRSRVACLEFLTSLVEAHPLKSIANPGKMMPMLAEVLKAD